jgi:hypothetical protein
VDSALAAILTVHLACGVRTHAIPACEVDRRDSSELEHFPSILSKVAENATITEAYGDKLYCTVDSYTFVAALGVTGYFAFREGFTGAAGGEFGRMFHIFMADPEGFWKHYHPRSNIETAISMMKTRIFGSRILCNKSPTGMKNEIYCPVIAHNVRCLIMCMFEHGIVPKLLVPVGYEDRYPRLHRSTKVMASNPGSHRLTQCCAPGVGFCVPSN